MLLSGRLVSKGGNNSGEKSTLKRPAANDSGMASSDAFEADSIVVCDSREESQKRWAPFGLKAKDFDLEAPYVKIKSRVATEPYSQTAKRPQPNIPESTLNLLERAIQVAQLVVPGLYNADEQKSSNHRDDGDGADTETLDRFIQFQRQLVPIDFVKACEEAATQDDVDLILPLCRDADQENSCACADSVPALFPQWIHCSRLSIYM